MSVYLCLEEEAEERGCGAGDGDPFGSMGNDFFRVPAGCVSQKEEGVCLALPAAHNVRDFCDGCVGKGNRKDFRKFFSKELVDFVHDFMGNDDTDTYHLGCLLLHNFRKERDSSAVSSISLFLE